MALMTIHMIGKNPKAAPSSPLFTASPTDIARMWARAK